MTEKLAPVEKTTRYATRVNTLSDAWVFVMEHIEQLGEAPSIEINPVWSSRDDFQTVTFTVVVSGMVET